MLTIRRSTQSERLQVMDFLLNGQRSFGEAGIVGSSQLNIEFMLRRIWIEI